MNARDFRSEIGYRITEVGVGENNTFTLTFQPPRGSFPNLPVTQRYVDSPRMIEQLNTWINCIGLTIADAVDVDGGTVVSFTNGAQLNITPREKVPA